MNDVKPIWLRDYDLPALAEKIREALAKGEDPEDCVVHIDEVEKQIRAYRQLIADFQADVQKIVDTLKEEIANKDKEITKLKEDNNRLHKYESFRIKQLKEQITTGDIAQVNLNEK